MTTLKFSLVCRSDDAVASVAGIGAGGKEGSSPPRIVAAFDRRATAWRERRREKGSGLAPARDDGRSSRASRCGDRVEDTKNFGGADFSCNGNFRT
jgi:hypothetical protein